MKFDIEKVNGRTAGLITWIPAGSAEIINGNVKFLEALLESYAFICGEKTKQRLCNAINKPHSNIINDVSGLSLYGVDYSDTPIRGLHYVYLWFDANGELFYIGKGAYGRATDMRSRKQKFRDRAEGGQCKFVAYNIDEVYALDLERILIWEAAAAGKQLLNIDGGNGVDAIQYCRHDRDALLWYWDHEGTIARFSELTELQVIYDARNMHQSKELLDAIDSRQIWWEERDGLSNNPKVLEAERKHEEMKQKAQEARAARRLKKKQEISCRA